MKKIILLIALSFILVGCKQTKTISPIDMLNAQINYNYDMSGFINDVADAYSDYLSYNKSDTLFMSELKGFIQYYEDYQEQYMDFKDKYIVEGASQEFYVVINGVEQARSGIGAILYSTIEDDQLVSRDKILEVYLKESEKMQFNLAIFNEYIKQLQSPSQ